MPKSASVKSGLEQAWPGEKITRRKVSSLVPYARNARTHSDAQVAQIMASIEEWGWTVPILIDEAGGIIAGHGRVLAAQRMGIDAVPCMVAKGWSDEKKRAYVIADNKLAENAGWDSAMLASELSDLAALGFDLDLIGFDEQELGELLQDEVHPEGLTDDDAVPEAPEQPVSKFGDVWLLGEHRLMCGDSTVPDYVSTLIAGELVDACWTDPPYNVNYQGTAGVIENDHMADSDFREFLDKSMACAYLALKAGGPIYVAHADTEGLNFRGAFIGAGFKLSGCLIWVKNSLVLGRSDYQWRHEPILYGWKPGAKHTWYGGRAKTTVQEAVDAPIQLQEDGSVLVHSGGQTFRISGADLEVEGLEGSILRHEKPARNGEHPTMKPVALISDMLKNSTKRGSVVLDLFGGSGSTLIACHKLGRAARLMEYDPKFCDVIVKRWQDFTGREAIHEKSGDTFGVRSKPARRKKAA